MERAMPEIAPQTASSAEDFYEVLRKHFTADPEPRVGTLHPVVKPF